MIWINRSCGFSKLLWYNHREIRHSHVHIPWTILFSMSYTVRTWRALQHASSRERKFASCGGGICLFTSDIQWHWSKSKPRDARQMAHTSEPKESISHNYAPCNRVFLLGWNFFRAIFPGCQRSTGHLQFLQDNFSWTINWNLKVRLIVIRKHCTLMATWGNVLHM